MENGTVTVREPHGERKTPVAPHGSALPIDFGLDKSLTSSGGCRSRLTQQVSPSEEELELVPLRPNPHEVRRMVERPS